MNSKSFLFVLVIVLIGSSYFFALQHYFGGQAMLASEIRAAFEELQDIADELSTTKEPGKIKALVSNFAGQVVDGVRSGIKTSTSGNDELALFQQVKPDIRISNLERGKTNWKHREKFIGVIKNHSAYPITQVKLNLSCYSVDGRLIDVENKWVADIKLLAPGESVSFYIDRNLGDHNAKPEELEKRRANTFTIKVLSFQVKDMARDGKPVATQTGAID